MRNRGFTLIELLGVIIILALLAMITVPAISATIKNSKEEADKQVEENIVLATKNWALDHKDELPTTPSATKKVPLSELQNEGYIDKNLKKPSTGKEITTACVNITTKNSQKPYTYNYKYNESCS